MSEEFKKSRRQFRKEFVARMKDCGIVADETVLVLGGSFEDMKFLSAIGFTHVINSNLPTDLSRTHGDGLEPRENGVPVDAEAINLPDESFDIVFAHEVLHHCRSPHLALCEMLRVCKKHALFLEPNDSLIMRFLEAAKLSFPYELGAVVGNGFRSGGVRDSQIPNFIYRWNRREVYKTVASFLPEKKSTVHCYGYWDFNATERDVDGKIGSRTSLITSIVGTRNFISALRFAQPFLNLLPPIRGQGNKFFCCVEKHPQLRPWLQQNGREIVYNPQFSTTRAVGRLS